MGMLNKEDVMGLRINTNVSSLSAQRSLSVNSEKQASTLGKLSSGSRIVRAADDARCGSCGASWPGCGRNPR